MKKKGLIIATIVMVLVLAVSLTTATYAWFTQTASSSVTNINLSVAAGSDIAIGLSKTGTITTLQDTSFVSGDLTFNASTKWDVEGNTEGMASSINTGLSLASIQMAVSTADATTSSANIDTDTTQLAHSSFIKAEGTNTTVSTGTIAEAVENTDYLHFTLGMLPTVDVTSYTLHITVAATDAKSIMGMTAGLHVIYKVNTEATWHNIDLGGNKTYTNPKTTARSIAAQSQTGYNSAITPYAAATTLGAITGNGDTSTAIGAGSTNIALTFGDGANTMSKEASAINQVEIYIYYVGTDADCRNEALVGSTATVYFTIVDTKD